MHLRKEKPMNKRRRFNPLLLISLALLTSGLMACSLVTQRTGPVQTHSETIELGAAESAAVEIAMGVGELSVSGGASELMEAEFTFNIADWEPEVDYAVSGTDGRLTISQPDDDFSGIPDDNIRYEWDLQFNDAVPLDLQIGLGAGDSDIDLQSLAVQSLELNTGAGDVTVLLGGSPLTNANIEAGVGEIMLDLNGDWQNDATISVEAGVGDLAVVVPNDVGVIVDADLGVGNVDADGFRIQGGSYTNDAYEDSAITISVDINGGIGQITLKVAE